MIVMLPELRRLKYALSWNRKSQLELIDINSPVEATQILIRSLEGRELVDFHMIPSDVLKKSPMKPLGDPVVVFADYLKINFPEATSVFDQGVYQSFARAMDGRRITHHLILTRGLRVREGEERVPYQGLELRYTTLPKNGNSH